MKYKANFSHTFSDTANPKRFQRDVIVAAGLEFPFPKQTDELVLQLKATDADRYKALKLDQFETYTGVKHDKFQSGFDAAIKKKIDANFMEYVKKIARPDFSQDQWDKLLTFFETKQVELVKAEFAKALAHIVKVNYEKLDRLKASAPRPDEDRLLDVDQAFLLWVGRKPVKFAKVEDKFYDDHFFKDVSEADAFQIAVGRYKKNKNVKTSSLVKAAPSSLLAKANGGKAYPAVYNGAQQIAVKVTCEVITAALTLEKVTGDKAIRQFQKDNKHAHDMQDGTWATATFKKGTQNFYVMGGWDPDTGEAILYHYQAESSKPDAAMLKKYLRWTYSNKEGKFLGPSIER